MSNLENCCEILAKYAVHNSEDINNKFFEKLSDCLQFPHDIALFIYFLDKNSHDMNITIDILDKIRTNFVDLDTQIAVSSYLMCEIRKLLRPK